MSLWVSFRMVTASSLEVVEQGSKSITNYRNDPLKYSLEAPSLKRSFISQQEIKHHRDRAPGGAYSSQNSRRLQAS